MKFKKLLLIQLLIFLVIGSSLAQDKEKSDWHYLTEIYLMFPTMAGDIGIGNLPPVEVDADAATIFGQIKMGAMLYFEATNDDWAITSDLIYMKLGQDIVPKFEVVSGDVTMKQTAWEVAGLKRFTSWLEGGLGGRLVSLSTALDLSILEQNGSADASKTWVDPIVILRTQGAVKEKWLLQFRGDVGGFGVGSDFSWQIQANVGYRFSDLFQATIGYRYIGIDYDKDGFMYDVDTYGPVVRMGFNF